MTNPPPERPNRLVALDREEVTVRLHQLRAERAAWARLQDKWGRIEELDAEIVRIVSTAHECDRDVVEQTPGLGHCVVRCPVCERAGIRTWDRERRPHVTWLWEIKARAHRTYDRDAQLRESALRRYRHDAEFSYMVRNAVVLTEQHLRAQREPLRAERLDSAERNIATLAASLALAVAERARTVRCASSTA